MPRIAAASPGAPTRVAPRHAAYHVHVQFLENNKASVAAARQLQADFVDFFFGVFF